MSQNREEVVGKKNYHNHTRPQNIVIPSIRRIYIKRVFMVTTANVVSLEKGECGTNVKKVSLQPRASVVPLRLYL